MQFEEDAEKILKAVAFKHDIRQREKALQKLAESAEQSLIGHSKTQQEPVATDIQIKKGSSETPEDCEILQEALQGKQENA